MFKEFLQNLVVNVPYITFMILGFIFLFGYRDKFSKSKVITYIMIGSILDSVIQIYLEKNAYMFISILISIILIRIMFKINPLATIVSYLILFFIDFVVQIIMYIILALGFKLDINIFSHQVYFTLCYIIVWVLALYNIIKSNFVILNMQKYNIFSDKKFNKFIDDNVKILLTTFLIFMIVNCINLLVYYYGLSNHKSFEPLTYLTLLFFNTIIFATMIIWLISKLYSLKQYQIKYNLRKKYSKSIKHLIKGLKYEKRTFSNYLNVINGYVSLGKCNEAQEYIQKIHKSIVTDKKDDKSEDGLDIINIINSKIIAAEQKNINIQVNNDANMKINAFEIEYAVTIIIDFIFKYVEVLSISKRNINVNTYSDDHNYSLEFDFTGEQIPENYLLDENEDLYISKYIINTNNGNMQLTYEKNDFNFYNKIKILFPKEDGANELIKY